MAFSNYHEKFRQIGTDPESYESWVDAEALLCGLGRLRNLMNEVSSPIHGNTKSKNNDKAKKSESKCGIAISLEGNSSFEQELSFDFAKDDYIKEKNNPRTIIIGVSGVCDWVNQSRTQDVETDMNGGTDIVDLLEIKFVHHLSNVHRLQVLVYTALYALKVNNVDMKKHTDGDTVRSNLVFDQGSNLDDDKGCFSVDFNSEEELKYRKEEIEWKVESCRGMLYNARTSEKEFCTIQSRNAMEFLLDISQFKYNGKDRKDLHLEQKSIVPKNDIWSEQNVICPTKEIKTELSCSIRKRKMSKNVLAKNIGTSYPTVVCIDDQDEKDDDSPNVKSTNANSLEKLRMKCLAELSQGTDDDPIIID